MEFRPSKLFPDVGDPVDVLRTNASSWSALRSTSSGRVASDVRLPPLIVLNRGQAVCPEHYGPITTEADCGGSGSMFRGADDAVAKSLWPDHVDFYTRLYDSSVAGHDVGSMT